MHLEARVTSVLRPRLVVVSGALACRARPFGVGAAAALMSIAGCSDDSVVQNEDEAAIDVGDASPQDTPIPSGDADAAERPQIEFVDAPETVMPGQVVNVRLGTNFMPADEVTGVAVVIDGVPGWFKAIVIAEPAPISDGVDYIVTVSVIIADTAPPGEQVKLEFALLLDGDAAGGFEAWEPSIDADDVVNCPEDIDCTATACGPDPICGFECGTCTGAEACNGDGQCEPVGSACPDIADCTDRECGADPVCGTECGTCDPGEVCDLEGICQPGEMTCGDDEISGDELCDGEQLGSETCVTQGFDGGTLVCNPGCDGFDTTGCTYSCGDGNIDPGETCDGEDVGAETCVSQGFDGGTLVCTGACDGYDTSGCTYSCGDGNVDPGEGCDDAGTAAGDGCDAACAVEAGYECTGDPSICTTICGDAMVLGAEICDGTNVGTETCQSQGFDSGTLTCNVACSGYDTSACAYVCGDGSLDPGETCDGADLNSETCASQGFDGGTLACTGSCAFDTASCFACGDGVLNGLETCDDTDFGTADCLDMGYDGGTASCNVTCDSIDYAGCTYTCGDNGTDPGETCDGTDLNGGDCLSSGFDSGAIACAGDCLSYDTAACAYTCGNDSASSTEACDGSDLKGEDCLSQGFDTGTLLCAGDCSGFDPVGCISIGVVGPLYPINGEGWNSWVSATGGDGPLDATDAACDPLTADQCTNLLTDTPGVGEFACQHAGVRRQIVLPYADCTSVVLSDSLSAFDWICDDSGSVTRAVSSGLKSGVHLSDLIDWSASPIEWLDNSVTYTDGVTPGNSTPAKWWTTPVTEYNSGGNLPATPGVFAVTANVALTFAFNASQQSLVTKPGVVISGLGLSTHVVETTATSGAPQGFLWLEATVDGQNDEDGVNLNYTPYLTVDNTDVQNVNEVQSSGLDIGANSHGVRVFDLTLDNVNEGVNFRGGDCNIVRDAMINGGANTTFSGLYLGNVRNALITNLESNTNANYGLDLTGSDYVIVQGLRALQNNAGGFKASSSAGQNRGFDFILADNGGPGLTGAGSSNHFKRVFSIGNSSHGIICTGCRVQRFLSANNTGDGIYGAEIASQGIAASNGSEGLADVEITVAVTSVLNQYEGFVNSEAPNLNLAAIDNLSYGIRAGASAYVSDLAALYNNMDSATNPWDIYESNIGAVFSGLLLVTDSTNSSSGNTSNGSCEASQADPVNAGQGIDDSCTAINGSDFTLVSAPGVPTFMGQATPDTVNASDGDVGTAVYEAITDWSDFENEFRAWGEDGAPFPDQAIPGVCATDGEVCAIWDWRVSPSDAVLRDALGVAYVVDANTDAVSYTYPTTFNTEIQCDALSGVWDSPIPGFCSVYFLRRAMELQGDGIGNDNALCESGEDCLRLRHIGGYQGSGNLVQVQTILTGGTVENVNLYEYDVW